MSVFLSVFLLSQFLRANKLFGPVFFVTMKVDGGGAGGGAGPPGLMLKLELTKPLENQLFNP